MLEFVNALVAWKLVIVFGWLAALFLAERALPAAPSGYGWLGDPSRLGRNVLIWGITAALSFAIVLPFSAWVAAHPLWARPDWLIGWHGLVVDLVLLDCWIYWWHRANHRVPALWRFHQVHHRDRFLDVTTQMRFHIGEVVLSALVRALVLLALAVPFSSVLVFEIALQIVTIFHHSNLRLAPWLERPLSWLVTTPSIHWVHHHRVQRDTDSNYSTIFSWWDWLFGSRSPTRRSPAMPIGVQGQEDLSGLGLLMLPFRR
jgi:sterol desaturase/sphingolipid hydroxylase (fatty acid hydroxylase superfamily)